jgi:hypothetical protein
MEILFRFDWLIFIAVGTVAVLDVRRQLRRQPIAAAVPLMIMNLPWFITGFGKFLYPARDTFDLFDLRLGLLPYMLVASIVAVWVALIAWLFRGGAEEIANSPQAARTLRVPENASSIKLLFVAALAGGVMGISMMVLTATEKVR